MAMSVQLLRCLRMRRLPQRLATHARWCSALAARDGEQSHCRELLGLGPEPIKKAELRSAYRTLARRLHPDLGGRREQFQELQRCYEALLATARVGDKAAEQPEWLAQMKKD